MRAAFFLDRDGVINRKLPEGQYVSNTNEFEFLPGAVEAVRILNNRGFLTIVITNQRGIGRSLMSTADLKAVHKAMLTGFKNGGADLTDIFYCPHDIPDRCVCRKPQPGLIWRALTRYDIDLTRSCLAGDSASDMLLGQRVGCKTFLITPENPLIKVVDQIPNVSLPT
ncbi:MAG: D-glycero-alpha-D-manno-heptose-1,7-bisphosphate 7-phosphatase [bacterium]